MERDTTGCLCFNRLCPINSTDVPYHCTDFKVWIICLRQRDSV
jgi:hypothetical protein